MKLAVVSEPESANFHVVERQPAAIELAVVMPCLNEAETLRTCILKAQNGDSHA